MRPRPVDATAAEARREKPVAWIGRIPARARRPDRPSPCAVESCRQCIASAAPGVSTMPRAHRPVRATGRGCRSHAAGRYRAGTQGVAGESRVASDQGAPLAYGAPTARGVVSRVIVGRVVPERAQPAGQAAKHDIAEKARGLFPPAVHGAGAAVLETSIRAPAPFPRTAPSYISSALAAGCT